MRDPKLIHRARALRRTPTGGEKALWPLLRAHRLNDWQFRRQADVAGFVVDFVCHELKLIVELDGPAHEDGEQQAFDAERDATHARVGYFVLRLDERTARDAPEQAASWIAFVGERIAQGLPPIPETEEER